MFKRVKFLMMILFLGFIYNGNVIAAGEVFSFVVEVPWDSTTKDVSIRAGKYLVVLENNNFKECNLLLYDIKKMGKDKLDLSKQNIISTAIPGLCIDEERLIAKSEIERIINKHDNKVFFYFVTPYYGTSVSKSILFYLSKKVVDN